MLLVSTEVVGALLDGLAGAVAGGVISAIMTSREERKRSQTEIALHFLEQFMSEYGELAKVKGMLLDSSALTDVDNLNRIRKFGDWYEIVAASCLADVVDRALLKKVGIPAEMRVFFESSVSAAKDVPSIAEALKGWTNLEQYINQGD